MDVLRRAKRDGCRTKHGAGALHINPGRGEGDQGETVTPSGLYEELQEAPGYFQRRSCLQSRISRIRPSGPLRAEEEQEEQEEQEEGSGDVVHCSSRHGWPAPHHTDSFQVFLESSGALLAGCDAFKLGSSQRVIPLSSPVSRLFQEEGLAPQPHFIQELVRTKRSHTPLELVRVQPHLVHDMAWPEIHETSRTQTKMDTANSSQLNPPLSSANQDVASIRTAVGENVDVEDEMERMVHLAVPRDSQSYRGQTDPETELLGGPGAGDASLEASGFYGTDTEERDRGEEAGEDRERRVGEERGEDEWERDAGEDRERRGQEEEEEEEEEEEREGGLDDQDLHELDALEVNHTTPDLDALIGYSPSFHPSSSKQPSISSPAKEHDSGLQEHRASPVLEGGPVETERWEAEGDEDGHSSGYALLHPSITITSTTSAAASTSTEATATPETDTGTDFGLLGSYTKGETEEEERKEEEEEEETGLPHIGIFTQNPTVPEVGMAPSRQPLQPSVEEEEELQQGEHELKGEDEEEEKWGETDEEETRIRQIIPLTTDPSPSVGFTDSSWDWMERTTHLKNRGSEVKGNVKEVFLPDRDFDEQALQVVCVDWSELTGRGYVILNMTQNLNCEEFRVDRGVRLLKIMERVFARRMNSPEGSWVLYLSKPTHQQHQLLMNVASEHGVIATKDVIGMLGEIRKCLPEVGIHNFSAASNCQSRPSQTRSDYGKLFVVLVIIGSICMVIITSGFIYICWQRRLPATKTTFRAEELHFVENGCHDNPMLDVTNDGQPEMQEKKPSTNGLSGVIEGGGEKSTRWQVFVNQGATEEEEEEQDTHL
ncbi:podocalyxin-like protein 2 [Scomber japonicus]|uniref:podocalyxin-like protein 2 n=1 Tax=Scomber japonicus TaxID=13676 RepID=UPI0023067A77|nr:podocalyxin-like protein 2 [Scomber japonicus]